MFQLSYYRVHINLRKRVYPPQKSYFQAKHSQHIFRLLSESEILFHPLRKHLRYTRGKISRGRTGYYISKFFFFGHRSFLRNNTQSAVTNITIKCLRSCLNELRKLLFQNGYPAVVINYKINDLNRQQNRPRNPITTVPKRETISVLPYLWVQSKIVTKQLKTCINKVAPLI